MEFKYSIIEPLPGWPQLKIEPNEYITGYIHNIGGWLCSDVQIFPEDYLPIVKAIMEGTYSEVEEEFCGNAYDTLVRKDYTTIKYIFEDKNPEMVPCTLPTQMLYEILEIWEKEMAKRREEKENKKEY